MTEGEVPLRDAFATSRSKERFVRHLFSTIADRYDLITVLLSFGRDRRWKQRVVDLVAGQEGLQALDLACGTGDIALALGRRGTSVVGLDVTHRMLVLARAKRECATGRLPGGPAEGQQTGPCARFVQGDMMALPFDDARFDVVTTGYGLRNVPELAPALREIHRVLRPGGTFVSLDFNRPDNRIIRFVYLTYLTAVGSALGWSLHGDGDTYRYIPASIRRYPGAPAVTALMTAEGFCGARWHRVLGGLMAIHVARKA